MRSVAASSQSCSTHGQQVGVAAGRDGLAEVAGDRLTALGQAGLAQLRPSALDYGREVEDDAAKVGEGGQQRAQQATATAPDIDQAPDRAEIDGHGDGPVARGAHPKAPIAALA